MEKPVKNLSQKPSQNKTPPRIRSSIRRDVINPTDYNAYKLPWSCEDCSHFMSAVPACSLGYRVDAHMRENMKKTYELSGTVSLCRFLEID